MTEVGGTPSSPLDRILYEKSQKWAPAKKETELAVVAEADPNPTIMGHKPLKLKSSGFIFDFAERKRIERIALMNRRAQEYEALLNAAYELSEEQERYKKQRAEMARLEAIFSSSILGFVVDELKSKADHRFKEEFLARDEQLREFDTRTEEQQRVVQETIALEEEAEEAINDVVARLDYARDVIRERIETSTSVEQVDELADALEEIEADRAEVLLLRQSEEPSSIATMLSEPATIPLGAGAGVGKKGFESDEDDFGAETVDEYLQRRNAAARTIQLDAVRAKKRAEILKRQLEVSEKREYKPLAPKQEKIQELFKRLDRVVPVTAALSPRVKQILSRRDRPYLKESALDRAITDLESEIEKFRRD